MSDGEHDDIEVEVDDNDFTVFATVHPTDLGNEVHANCPICGEWAALGVRLEDDDQVVDPAVDAWWRQHECGELNEYGISEYGIGRGDPNNPSQ